FYYLNIFNLTKIIKIENRFIKFLYNTNMTSYKKAFIYRILIGNKSYIGSTFNWSKRKYKHIEDFNNDEKNRKLYVYMKDNNYKIEDIQMEIIEEWYCCNKRQLEFRETFWQVFYNTKNNGL